MSRVRVEIDLNSRSANGLTRTRLSNADGELHKGQIVTAFEPEDEAQALAYVARVDSASGYAFLAVNWESLCDDDGTDIRLKQFSNRAASKARAHASAAGVIATQGAVGFVQNRGQLA